MRSQAEHPARMFISLSGPDGAPEDASRPPPHSAPPTLVPRLRWSMREAEHAAASAGKALGHLGLRVHNATGGR